MKHKVKNRMIKGVSLALAAYCSHRPSFADDHVCSGSDSHAGH